MSTRIRICIAGLTGKVGRLLAQAIVETDGLELVGGVSRKHAGVSIKEIIRNCKNDFAISSDVSTALDTPTDVLIDYTHPDVVERNVLESIDKDVHVIIGTSGLTDAQYEEIHRRAVERNVGVLAAGNFSLSGALMQHFALIAAHHIPTWEIVDFGVESKPDAPSGTARELAYRLSEVRTPHYEIPASEIRGEADARGTNLNGSQVHSFRLPGYFSRSEVLFGAPEQRLTVRYEAIGNQPYVDGTLLGVRKVMHFVGLKRGLDKVLEL